MVRRLKLPAAAVPAAAPVVQPKRAAEKPVVRQLVEELPRPQPKSTAAAAAVVPVVPIDKPPKRAAERVEVTATADPPSSEAEVTLATPRPFARSKQPQIQSTKSAESRCPAADEEPELEDDEDPTTLISWSVESLLFAEHLAALERKKAVGRELAEDVTQDESTASDRSCERK
ncbi:hypothetical protein M3Y99_00595800 [Aphelenchoides fujianensis]|nr:hypothetical protein M3Y99_00595800 [Aphelenchoides fujianensis]